MISHEHKCIFIHISKCAGTSVEKALGLKNWDLNYDILWGWCPQNRLYLQHATPQQLRDLGYIDEKIWEEYYKFIIVRDPWDRAYSDYLWAIDNLNMYDGFSNFIQGKGKFRESLSRETDFNIADHIYAQSDYFKLGGTAIEYDKVIRFENLEEGLHELATDLSMPPEVFKKKENVNKKRFRHYSVFYTRGRKKLVDRIYAEDIELFDYTFIDNRNFGDRLRAKFLLWFHPNGKRFFLLKYPGLGSLLVSFKGLFK
jgi:Sulfotransferase family